MCLMNERCLRGVGVCGRMSVVVCGSKMTPVHGPSMLQASARVITECQWCINHVPHSCHIEPPRFVRQVLESYAHKLVTILNPYSAEFLKIY